MSLKFKSLKQCHTYEKEDEDKGRLIFDDAQLRNSFARYGTFRAVLDGLLVFLERTQFVQISQYRIFSRVLID